MQKKKTQKSKAQKRRKSSKLPPMVFTTTECNMAPLGDLGKW
jgi:hypothetical protein